MNAKKWPTTVDEAIGVVLATLSEEEKSQITEMAAADLIDLHFGLGASIRNNFGLWHDTKLPPTKVGGLAQMGCWRLKSPTSHPSNSA